MELDQITTVEKLINSPSEFQRELIQLSLLIHPSTSSLLLPPLTVLYYLSLLPSLLKIKKLPNGSGTLKSFNKEGKLMMFVEFPIGLYEKYYPTGEILVKTNIANSKYVGIATSYLEDGSVYDSHDYGQ